MRYKTSDGAPTATEIANVCRAFELRRFEQNACPFIESTLGENTRAGRELQGAIARSGFNPVRRKIGFRCLVREIMRRRRGHVKKCSSLRDASFSEPEV